MKYTYNIISQSLKNKVIPGLIFIDLILTCNSGIIIILLMSQELFLGNKTFSSSQSKSTNIEDDFLKKEDIRIDDFIPEIDQCFTLLKNKCK